MRTLLGVVGLAAGSLVPGLGCTSVLGNFETVSDGGRDGSLEVSGPELDAGKDGKAIGPDASPADASADTSPDTSADTTSDASQDSPEGDSSDAGCDAGAHLCGGDCVSNSSVDSCGPTSCSACVPPSNANATCDGTSCGFSCVSPYFTCGGACCEAVEYGYDTLTTGTSGDFGANYLLGEEISVTAAMTLTSFGLYSSGAGPNVEMALYTATSGGLPGDLVASTASTTVVTGANTIPAVSSVAVPAGSYWIMAVYDGTGGALEDALGANPIEYVSLTYGSALPTVFSTTPMSYTGNHFAYYVIGTGM